MVAAFIVPQMGLCQVPQCPGAACLMLGVAPLAARTDMVGAAARENRGKLAQGAKYGAKAPGVMGAWASWGTWAPSPGCFRQHGCLTTDLTRRCWGPRPWLFSKLLHYVYERSDGKKVARCQRRWSPYAVGAIARVIL